MIVRVSILVIVVVAVLPSCATKPYLSDLPPCASAFSDEVPPIPTPERAAALRDSIAGADGHTRSETVAYDPPPRLASRSAAANVIERRYPPQLRAAGVGGVVAVWAFVDFDGRVTAAQVARSSGSLDLDRAGVEAVRSFRFHPAVAGDCRAGVWTQVPVTFSAK